MNCSLSPPTPPCSLISANATSTPSRTLWPSSDNPPENGPLMPTFTGSSARAGSAAITIAAPAARTARRGNNLVRVFWIMVGFLRFLLVIDVGRSPLELQPDRLAVPKRRAVFLGPDLQLVFLDLLACGLGQRLDEMHEARHHEMRHVLVGKAHQFFLADLMAIAADDVDHHLVFAEFGSHRHRRDFQHAWVSRNQHLDLIGGDVLAAAADRFLLAVDEIEIAVSVQPPAIPGMQPQIPGVARRGFRHLVISGHDDAALARPDADLADLADPQWIVLVADDLDFRKTARLAGGSAFGLGIFRCEHGHGKSLGHRIERGDLNAEALGYFTIGLA